MEPRAYVEPGSGKHCVFTHFPKDPNCDFRLKTKITRLLSQDALTQSWPERKISVCGSLQITKFQVKKVNRGTIINMPWWYKTWQRSGYSLTRAKQKIPRDPGELYEVPGVRKETKISYTEKSLEFGNYPGIIVRQHHTDQTQMGLLKEQCVQLRKGHLRYCCNQSWMENGGRTPWNVIAICEISRINSF